jgi:uncharacterized membrane protein
MKKKATKLIEYLLIEIIFLYLIAQIIIMKIETSKIKALNVPFTYVEVTPRANDKIADIG